MESPTTPLERLNEASRKAVEVVSRFANTDPPLASECQTTYDDTTTAAAAETETETTINPWRNPQLIQDELVVARNELAEAWKNLKAERDNEKAARRPATGAGNDDDDDDENDEEQMHNNVNNNNSNNNKNGDDDDISEEEFRVLYMDMITDAFGDVLGQMNKGEDDTEGNEGSKKNQSKSTTTTKTTPIDVDVLVDCLQSGIEFLDPDQQNSKSFFDSLDYDGNNNDDEDMALDLNGTTEQEELTTVHEIRQHSLGYLVSTGVDE